MKLTPIFEFVELSKQWMDYENHKLRFWLGFPRAFVRFLWFSRHDPFWK